MNETKTRRTASHVRRTRKKYREFFLTQKSAYEREKGTKNMTIRELVENLRTQKQHVSMLVKHNGSKYAIEHIRAGVFCLNQYPHSVEEFVRHFSAYNMTEINLYISSIMDADATFIPYFSCDITDGNSFKICSIETDPTHVYLLTEM